MIKRIKTILPLLKMVPPFSPKMFLSILCGVFGNLAAIVVMAGGATLIASLISAVSAAGPCLDEYLPAGQYSGPAGDTSFQSGK